MKENDNNSLAETLVNYEMLIEMIPELGEVIYTGMVTVDAARAVFQELPPEGDGQVFLVAGRFAEDSWGRFGRICWSN